MAELKPAIDNLAGEVYVLSQLLEEVRKGIQATGLLREIMGCAELNQDHLEGATISLIVKIRNLLNTRDHYHCTECGKVEEGDPGGTDLYGTCDACEVAITEPSLEQRIDDHEKWKVEVRDPARESSEGLRELKVPGAEANYEIGRTKSGKWAITMHASYTRGDCSGKGNPWAAYETREECVERFLQFARQHFGHDNIQDSQKAPQKAMLALLKGGLFWQEPEPEKPQYLPA